MCTTSVKLLDEGDTYATKTFEDQNALDTFLKVLKLDSSNYEALWRISRSYVTIAQHLPTITDEQKTKQLEMYDKGLEYANRAIQANPNGSEGYTRRAIANGRVALFKGVWDSIDIVKQVKADCEKAIQLDSNNATPYYVLARAHAKLCEKPKFIRWPLGLAWANLDSAAKNYERAIARRSDFIMFRLDAARTYVELEEYEKAKHQLYKIPTLPTEDEDDPQYRKEANELLETIKDK
ncbi:MAG: tetratricopeptide repeat protein [Bacteroidota bacterium]|nr:tetratricopeptide repeat protein [Bacteroidota bacterium]